MIRQEDGSIKVELVDMSQPNRLSVEMNVLILIALETFMMKIRMVF